MVLSFLSEHFISTCRMKIKHHMLIMPKSFKTFTMFVQSSVKLHDTFLIFPSRNISAVKLTMLLAIWDQETSQQTSQVEVRLNLSLPTNLSDLKIISYCFDMFKLWNVQEIERLKLLVSPIFKFTAEYNLERSVSIIRFHMELLEPIP